MENVDQVRLDILRRVAAGELTPEQAEIEAAKNGWPPFAFEPNVDEERFDPFLEPYWRLPMAVAWISRRTKHAVQMQMDQFRSAVTRWRRFGSGFDLEKLGRASLMEMAADEMDADEIDPSDGETLVHTVRQSRDELWRGLKAGVVSAVGLEVSSGGQKQFQSAEWAYLVLEGTQNLSDRVKHSSGAVYADVIVLSIELTTVWKPIVNGQSEVPPIAGRRRSQRKQDLARAAVADCFSGGVPNSTQMTDGDFVKRVADFMDRRAEKDRAHSKAPSRDTILRAAGRR